MEETGINDGAPAEEIATEDKKDEGNEIVSEEVGRGDQAEGDHVEGEHVASEHVASVHVASEHVASEHVASEHVASEHVAREHVASEHVASEHVASEHVASEHVASEHIASEHVDGEHAEGEHVEGEDVAGEQVEGEHVEGEHVEGEHIEGEQTEGEHTEGEHVETEHIITEGEEKEKILGEGEELEGEGLEGEHIEAEEKKEEVKLLEEVVEEEEEKIVEEPPPDPAAPYNFTDSQELLKEPFELRPDQIAEVEQIWELYQDYTPVYTDIDNYITDKELVYMLKSLLIMTYTPEQLQELIDFCVRPPHPKGHINYDQFLKMVTMRQRDFPVEEELRSALQVLDPDRTGTVDRDALKDLLATKGHKMAQRPLDHLIKEVDMSNDGTIGVEDVVGTMCIDLNREDIQMLMTTLNPPAEEPEEEEFE